jgi:spermidine synthase
MARVETCAASAAPPAGARPGLLYALFTVSGACGLAYQVLWARWLSLVLGNTTASVTLVLASFMLGLALGSWAAGRALARVARPLRAYGLLEVAIGLWAILFPFITGAGERLLTAVVAADSPRPLALAARSLVALAVLLVPTTLMGATLPQLVDLLRRLAVPGRRWRLGLLYALNTAGAASGTVAVSFLGIELLGVRGTTLVAAALNLAVGWLAIRADASLPTLDPAAAPPPPRLRCPAATLALAVLVASGAAALAGEVLWTRWLEALVGNSSYAFALMLVVYLVGIAAGAALPSLLIGRLRHLGAWLVGTQLLVACWLPLAVASLDRLAVRLSRAAGAPVSMAALLGVFGLAALVLLPVALLSGAVFPLATRLLSPGAQASGDVAGRAYAWNTLGAVAGALVGGWLIAPRFDFAEAVLALAVGYAAIAACAGLALLRPALDTPRPLAATLFVAALGLAVGAAALASARGGYPARLERDHPGMRVPFHARSAQGITTVVVDPGGDRFDATLLVNATGMTRLVTTTKLMAHLPLLAHPAPRETLVICFGMGTTFRSAMSHGGHVTAVELVPEVVDAFGVFHPDAARLRADARGRVVVGDGRNFLLLTRERFDVITVDPPPPIDGAGVNHLYSRDFLRLAHSRLRPGGIMAHWIPYPGTGSGVADWQTFLMLVRGFTDVFPVVQISPGMPNIGMHLLGSDRPFRIDPETLRARLSDPAVVRDLEEWEPVPRSLLLGMRTVEPSSVAQVPAVTDDRPRLEFDLVRLWHAGRPKQLHQIHW